MAQYDTVIKNGTIIDGTGLPRFRGDIAIHGGRIAKIGKIDDTEGAEVIDATGLIVAPGFVDLHTHYDAQVHWDPYCTISGWHGVTSVAIGNCGFGFAPATPDKRERLLQMMTRTEQIPYESMVEGMGLDWEWETLPEWMDHLEKLPKGVNLLNYVPLNPLLVHVLGLEGAKSGREPTADEMGELKRLINEAMDAGMMGWSCQRLGAHSIQADFDGTPMPTDMVSPETLYACADVLQSAARVSSKSSTRPMVTRCATPIPRTAVSWKRLLVARTVRCYSTRCWRWTIPAATMSISAPSPGSTNASSRACRYTGRQSPCVRPSTSRLSTGTFTTRVRPGTTLPRVRTKSASRSCPIPKCANR